MDAIIVPDAVTMETVGSVYKYVRDRVVVVSGGSVFLVPARSGFVRASARDSGTVRTTLADER